MRLDNLGTPIFSSQDIFELIYQGKLDILPKLLTEAGDPEIIKFNENSDGIKLKEYQELSVTVEEFDQALQSDWFMPDKYKTLDIEEWLLDSCPEENHQRLIDELQEYRARNMLNLLRWLKYFVDTCRKNNIVWGVGRGSSVASYTLYLLEVHKIDSLKYNLDWREFLR